MMRKPAVVLLTIVLLVTGCAKRTSPTVAPTLTLCDTAASRDARNLLHSTARPQHHLSKPWEVDYVVLAPSGQAYFSYTVAGGDCILSHVDARWEHHAVPLVFHLSGGNLQSATLLRLGGRARLVVVDRWGRTLTTTLKGFPAGLTLWGESSTGPLRVALGSRWQTEAGPDIFVGKSGPQLFYVDERTTPPPREWDPEKNAFVQRVSVYTP
jgi:hypothetical protein